MVPYSRKFSRGRNFRNFRNQTPACENFFPRKSHPPKIFYDNIGQFCVELLDRFPRLVVRKKCEQTVKNLRDLRSTRLPSPQLRMDPRSSLACFGTAVLCRQQPTCFDNIASYYRFNVETHAEFPGRVALSVREL